MVSLKGMTVAIVSDREAIPEYPDPDAQVPIDRTAYAYVEAKPGAQFKFYITVDPQPPLYEKVDGMCYIIFIDGSEVVKICKFFESGLMLHMTDAVYYAQGWKKRGLRFGDAISSVLAAPTCEVWKLTVSM